MADTYANHTQKNSVRIFSHCVRIKYIQTRNNRKWTISCLLLNYTTTETICECTISTSASNQRSRRLIDEVTSVEEDSGVMQLVAISEYVTADFFNTFSAAPSLNSAASVEKVVTVIVMKKTDGLIK